MKKSPSTVEILTQLRVKTNMESKSDVYLFLLQSLVDEFGFVEAHVSIIHQQNKALFSKFYACWATKNNFSTTLEDLIPIAKIPHKAFIKCFVHFPQQPKHELTLYQDYASFRSSLYYFVFKTSKSITQMEQDLLSQFLGAIVITLPTFFQLKQLSKNNAFYESENERLKEVVSSQNCLARSDLNHSYSGITGESKSLLKLLQYLDQVIENCDKRDTIYIHGESGTGKSLLANSIHRYSNRKSQKFIEVNCGAIVENLCEAEFFGIAPNSGIANASRDGKPGLFELANKGTIFLDEISELSLPTQAALLTVIEGKPFRRVCGKKDIKTDVRIISASIHDIKKMPPTEFLPELAQRLDGIRIEVPPLRERIKDIEKLVAYFCDQLSVKRREKIKPEMIQIFKRYDWPGNIRELANCIRRCSINGEIPPHLEKLASEAQYVNMKTLDELLNIEKAKIIEKRIAFLLAKDANSTLQDIAKSFGMKRDALRRRLTDVGLTWEKMKRKYSDE